MVVIVFIEDDNSKTASKRESISFIWRYWFLFTFTVNDLIGIRKIVLLSVTEIRYILSESYLYLIYKNGVNIKKSLVYVLIEFLMFAGDSFLLSYFNKIPEILTVYTQG